MVMRENELTREIKRIASRADALKPALTEIEALLSSEWGAALLVIREAATPVPFPSADFSFLESHNFPFRGMYTSSIQTGGGSDDRLLACIGTWGAPDKNVRQIIDFVGQQLSLRANHYAEAA